MDCNKYNSPQLIARMVTRTLSIFIITTLKSYNPVLCLIFVNVECTTPGNFTYSTHLICCCRSDATAINDQMNYCHNYDAKKYGKYRDDSEGL